MTWRAKGYIWGNRRQVVLQTEPLDLVNLPRFDTPLPIRIDVEGPAPGSAVFVRFFVEVGRGDGFAQTQEILWNQTTGKGRTVVYGSSVRVSAVYVSGLPYATPVYVTAWATPVEDGGIVAGRPKPFGTYTAGTANHARFAQSTTAATFTVGGEMRRITIANYQPGGGTAYLYLRNGSAPVLTPGAEAFDFIVAPQATHIEEAWEGVISGVWDAAGAGCAVYNRYLD